MGRPRTRVAPTGAALETANALATANVGLAYQYAFKCRWTGIETDEVLGLCMEGLIEASRAYDPVKARFSTLAYKCMKNKLMNHLQTSHYACREVHHHTRQMTPLLDMPCSRRRTQTQIDDADAVAFVLSKLNNREREVLESRHFKDETLKEVGDSLGITREGARLIEAKALEKCRRMLAL